MTILFFLVLTGLIGLCIGSYIAARAYRIIHDIPTDSFGRSHCMHCKKTLTVRDLIPLLSYLFSRGKCRHCAHTFSSYYFWVELSTGLLFTLSTYLVHSQLMPIESVTSILLLGFTLAITGLFIYISLIDLYLMAFPIVGIVVACFGTGVMSVLFGLPTPLTEMFFGGTALLIGMLAFSKIGQLIWKQDILGEGDIFLGTLIGMLLGTAPSIVALYIAVITGALIGAPLLFIKKERNIHIPFGPFLCVGGYVAFFFGQYVVDWYLQFLMYL